MDVLCPTCRSVLDVSTTLKDVHNEPYEPRLRAVRPLVRSMVEHP
jgi:hypothetical protein